VSIVRLFEEGNRWNRTAVSSCPWPNRLRPVTTECGFLNPCCSWRKTQISLNCARVGREAFLRRRAKTRLLERDILFGDDQETGRSQDFRKCLPSATLDGTDKRNDLISSHRGEKVTQKVSIYARKSDTCLRGLFRSRMPPSSPTDSLK
jgi:hypothetical protein